MPRTKTRKSAQKAERLTGKELLAQVKKLSGSNKTEKAKACGYVTKSKNGKERVRLSQFMNALLEAQGIDLDGQASAGKRGRSLSYSTSVQSTGNVVIGAGYMRELGWKSGDTLEIKTGRKYIKLLLKEDSSDQVEAEFESFDHEDDDEFDSDEIE
ncbi:AbrB-like transcriptional regulator [Lyngbya confervoides]|uniref:AbrB family transcriptional regulator n=1 Tax=Lyngbya confervoides BDU141951 TaxID=1574623 RepID=A0ABD4T7L9_9CYAN|nr:AbrB-like transcriptional regulator [Lyngbya confervoides]MCM1984439.1 AbrB family transcriptional regulator [Lyngbya confervoides BDU141951]